MTVIITLLILIQLGMSVAVFLSGYRLHSYAKRSLVSKELSEDIVSDLLFKEDPPEKVEEDSEIIDFIRRCNEKLLYCLEKAILHYHEHTLLKIDLKVFNDPSMKEGIIVFMTHPKGEVMMMSDLFRTGIVGGSLLFSKIPSTLTKTFLSKIEKEEEILRNDPVSFLKETLQTYGGTLSFNEISASNSFRVIMRMVDKIQDGEEDFEEFFQEAM